VDEQRPADQQWPAGEPSAGGPRPVEEQRPAAPPPAPAPPGAKGSAGRDAYRAAGVDVEAGERAVALMRDAVASTWRREVVGGLGGFAGAMELPEGYRRPLLVASTDGVGTKVALARRAGRLDGLGIDLVAMCADDVACAGAEPLFLLDYVAVGRVVPDEVAALVGGVAAGCRLAGCTLLGGETAEHPGVMRPDDLDLAATCVGVVERDDLLDGRSVAAGDVLLGLPSSGLHSNGFSLVRRLVEEAGLDLEAPYAAVLARHAPGVPPEPALADRPLADVLLEPTRVYARSLLAIRVATRAGVPGADVHGIAHVTGGGLPGNVPRIVPDGLAARVDPTRWAMPSVMRLLGAVGGLKDRELRATFNGGIGMVLAVPPTAVDAALAEAAWQRIPGIVIGEVVTAAAGGRRYVEVG
jgi:phosphoribosylformylglycinamidine cyclo-ligase